MRVILHSLKKNPGKHKQNEKNGIENKFHHYSTAYFER